MARSNVVRMSEPIYTHEGARVVKISPIQQLKRMIYSAFLFEDSFYESGDTHASNVAEVISKINPDKLVDIIKDCRDKFHLRHMPLFLIRELARVKGNGTIVCDLLEHCIQRADEPAEYLAMYFKDNPNQPLSAGSKRGLAKALAKFSAYDLMKYKGDRNLFKLKDVFRLVHPTPNSREQERLWHDFLEHKLQPADTWEVELSAGKDKKEVFERLLSQNKLGGLAFLRNLRNMIGAKVDDSLIRQRFEGPFKRVLPFRFITALRYAPQYAGELDKAMLRGIEDLPKLDGTTGLLVDVSGSMVHTISRESEVTRLDVAAAMGIIVSAICSRFRVWTFSKKTIEVPAFPGLGLLNMIKQSQPNMDTFLSAAVREVSSNNLDRLIIITDEQSNDRVEYPKSMRTYVVNVAAYQNGVGYGDNVVHINGWSEKVIDFIREFESETATL